MKRLLPPLIFLLIYPCLLHSAEDPALLKRVEEGINAIYDLRYDDAQKIFDQLTKDYLGLSKIVKIPLKFPNLL